MFSFLSNAIVLLAFFFLMFLAYLKVGGFVFFLVIAMPLGVTLFFTSTKPKNGIED